MGSKRLTSLVVCLLVGSISATRVRYDNYNVYKVLPKEAAHLQLLSRLEAHSDSLKFLTPIIAVGRTVNILVAPHKQPEFLDILKDNNISYELAVKNFQKVLDAEEAERRRSKSSVYDWTGYHTLEETYAWLQSLEEQFPQYVKVVNAGKSYEGRDLLGVKVSFKAGNKAVFIEGGIHAREWISPATVTYLLNQILTSKDIAVRDMAEKHDWYVFPHVNPDGFVYTHTTDRLWRKTRSKGVSCYGADANRNWDYKWMSVGASNQECAETYAGKSAFSEIEMKNMAEYIEKEKDNIRLFISFHSFGQLMLFPYSWTNDPAPNNDDHQRIGDAAAAALVKRYGTVYTVGNSYITIYPTSGSSDDWVYGVLNIPLSYTIELRPEDSINGFVLPSAQIIPVGIETLDGLVAMVNEADSLGYFE
ncbi:unnamed protein product [Hermetia illucens]|uniref:Zinc carboxypeptidase A 1 n=1 Tax=Hermetia illucens TaxID=343691 RepID=A0A7R8YVJ4_HERIL|nr:zinc carboxypeptidase-like [Hermetia illucens]CAD7086389.1 unnamed protein product [Hermetia illucens]